MRKFRFSDTLRVDLYDKDDKDQQLSEQQTHLVFKAKNRGDHVEFLTTIV